MSIFATAGSKIFLGGAKAAQAADLTSADFTAETWVQVGSVESIGSVGDTSTEVTFDDVGRGRTQKLKGSRNGGTMELIMAIDYSDPGQLALIAAEKTPYSYSVKIEFNDKPSTGGSPKNSTRMFIAKVMSAAEALDGSNNVMKLNVSLAVDSNIVRTNASAT